MAGAGRHEGRGSVVIADRDRRPPIVVERGGLVRRGWACSPATPYSPGPPPPHKALLRNGGARSGSGSDGGRRQTGACCRRGRPGGQGVAGEQADHVGSRRFDSRQSGDRDQAQAEGRSRPPPRCHASSASDPPAAPPSPAASPLPPLREGTPSWKRERDRWGAGVLARGDGHRLVHDLALAGGEDLDGGRAGDGPPEVLDPDLVGSG